ncbi:uncharacterized protein LOC120012372 [Tripterygium wilfordii]|uniref:uncharacterized protein LOC120012372 n=1 Tax=Tripterygium wilfordii TaxID=458696 RepID=UPI0018F83964|nr:uncharacterized protein LOC120012372 [Tripterygium wilfordii]
MVARKGTSGSYRFPSTKGHTPLKSAGSTGSFPAKESGSSVSRSLPKKGDRECSFCGKDHTVDKCWKLHGRPDWADDLIGKKQGSRASLVTTTTTDDDTELEKEDMSGSLHSGGDWAWF